MKEFFKALLYVFITQIVCWGIFTLCDEFPLINQDNAESLALTIGLLLSLIILILYFVFVKVIINKNKLNSKLFNVFLISLWIVISLLNSYIFTSLVDEGVLHYCESYGWNCFLNGIEYVMYGILLVVVSLVIILWKIFSGIYRFFKKRSFFVIKEEFFCYQNHID